MYVYIHVLTYITVVTLAMGTYMYVIPSCTLKHH